MRPCEYFVTRRIKKNAEKHTFGVDLLARLGVINVAVVEGPSSSSENGVTGRDAFLEGVLVPLDEGPEARLYRPRPTLSK